MGVTATTLSNLSATPLTNYFGEMMVAATLAFLLAYLDLLRVRPPGRAAVADVERSLAGAILPLGVTFALVIGSHALGII